MTMPSPMLASLYVTLGGGLGSLLRYQTGRVLTWSFGPQTMTAFPWATLTVNVVGSLLMGGLMGFLARQDSSGEVWRLLIGAGLLGGFTTFSSFSLELMMLIERGQPALALTYAAVSLFAGLTALYIGMIVMRVAA